MKRVFIAVDISDEARRQAAAHIERLRSSFARLRVGWERPEKLHITLKFLGAVSDEQLSGIERAVRAVALQNSEYRVKLAGTGVFPETRDPRILWIGLEPSAATVRLAHAIDDVCAKLGFEPEKRRFKPHLTIGRLREPAASRELAEAHRRSVFEPTEFPIKEITIYESKLLPIGSVYSSLAAFPLDGN